MIHWGDVVPHQKIRIARNWIRLNPSSLWWQPQISAPYNNTDSTKDCNNCKKDLLLTSPTDSRHLRNHAPKACEPNFTRCSTTLEQSSNSYHATQILIRANRRDFIHTNLKGNRTSVHSPLPHVHHGTLLHIYLYGPFLTPKL